MPPKKEDKSVRPAGQLALTQMFARAPTGASAAVVAAPSAPAATSAAAAAAAPAAKHKVFHSTDKEEFEIRLPGAERAYLSYAYPAAYAPSRPEEVVLDLTHTSVPASARNKGIAGELVRTALEFAKKEGLRVRPSCSYIGDFIKKNPSWQGIIEAKPNARHAQHRATAGAAAGSQAAAAAGPAAAAASGNGGKTFHKQPGNHAAASSAAASSPHFASAAAAAPSDSLQPPARADRERGGEKRHSPEHEAGDWRSKKAKGDPAAAAALAAPAAASAAAPPKGGAVLPPQGHVPLPFCSLFTKKWAATLSAVEQALSVQPSLDSAFGESGAIDDVVDLARRVSFSRRDLDARALGMKYFFSVYCSQAQRQCFLQNTVPFLLQLIADLPNTFDASRPENANLKSYPPAYLPILRTKLEASLTLTKYQLVSLLACSFFGLQAEHQPKPDRGGSGFGALERRFKSSNFDGLWLNIGNSVRHHLGTNDTPEEIRSENHTEVQKLLCLLEYFERMRTRVQGAGEPSHPQARLFQRILAGIVTFHRKVLKLDAAGLEARLTGANSPAANAVVSARTDLREVGTIEDDGYGTLQIDFANKCLGGGVLTGGCIQEEIRLTICPETLVGLLFVEVMEANESVVMIGAERFADYTGYSRSFQFAGPHFDPTPVDPVLNRMQTVLIAIDAIAFRKPATQYEKHNILREILKAYAGFSIEDSVIGVRQSGKAAARASENYLAGDTASPTSIAAAAASDYSFQEVSTGNWGCGAFGAEVPLKLLIQLLAATLSRCSLRYFTFSSAACSTLPALLSLIDSRKPTVKQLYQACLMYQPWRARGRTTAEYISDLLDGSDAQKQQQWQAKEAAAAAASRAAAASSATAASSRPPLSRNDNAARPAAASHLSSLDADPMEEDPIEDADDINSEDERALREAEGYGDD